MIIIITYNTYDFNELVEMDLIQNPINRSIIFK